MPFKLLLAGVGSGYARPRALLALPILLVLAGVLLGIGVKRGMPDPWGPTYTVATLRAELPRDPEAWVDRTVRVQAIPTRRCVSWVAPQTPPCLAWYEELLNTGAPQGAKPLPLVPGRTPPLVAWLRRVPLAPSWLPAPQTLHWGVAGVYQVQIHALPCDTSGWDDCYEALLLDPAPQDDPARPSA